MIKKTFLFSFALAATQAFAQSYAPHAGQTGTTAIHKDSSVFIAWATGIVVERGYVDAGDTTVMYDNSNRASFGIPENALNKAEGTSGSVVSLGDGGKATLTFAQAIMNGAGPDFAIFENGLSDTFLELAFVEVSSDGFNFFRFPSHSETQTATQIDGFGNVDCRYIHNLAGKYKAAYGTPFDLSDLPIDALLDINNITHIRIIDVVGSIDPLVGSKDSQGNMINDLYPTPFHSGGFDLDAIGVIHQKTLGVSENELTARIYPNPTKQFLNVELNAESRVSVYDLTGKLWIEEGGVMKVELDLSGLNGGIYLVKVESENQVLVKKVLLEK
jgi:hypothetical protein